MIDGIPLSLPTLGATGLLAVAVLLTLTGRLVARSVVTTLEARHERELVTMETRHVRELQDISHDRDEWRTAHRISEQARLEEREQNTQLREGIGATLTGFLAGFRRATEEAAHAEGRIGDTT